MPKSLRYKDSLRTKQRHANAIKGKAGGKKLSWKNITMEGNLL